MFLPEPAIEPNIRFWHFSFIYRVRKIMGIDIRRAQVVTKPKTLPFWLVSEAYSQENSLLQQQFTRGPNVQTLPVPITGRHLVHFRQSRVGRCNRKIYWPNSFPCWVFRLLSGSPATRQLCRNPKNIKSFLASVCLQWTTRWVGVVGRLGNYFKLLESKEDNQRVPKSSQLCDLKNEQEGANSVAVSRKRLSLNEMLLFTSPNFAWRSMRTKVFAVGLPFLPCC